MIDLTQKKIAIVCDWIKDFGGAELVLSHLMEMFPQADIYTSVFYRKDDPLFEDRNVYSSSIQSIPFFNSRPKLSLTLRPRAFENFDLSDYDIVISSSSAESKGVITKPETLHICFCHTPTRYFWSHYHEYLNMMEFGFLNPIGKLLMPRIVNKLRLWDFQAAQRPDYFIANSINTSNRIAKYYRRDSDVIYPGIDTSTSYISEEKDDYYFAIGRMIPYKKFDLLVDAFNANGKRLIIATNTQNKLLDDLIKKSKDNIEWDIGCSEAEKIELYSKAKAFLFPPEEDFGLVPIEAMACGTPVIAYGKGGATETVIDGKTGVFFEEQTVESLNEAIERFEEMEFDSEEIRNYALGFDKRVFQEKIWMFIQDKIS